MHSMVAGALRDNSCCLNWVNIFKVGASIFYGAINPVRIHVAGLEYAAAQ